MKKETGLKLTTYCVQLQTCWSCKNSKLANLQMRNDFHLTAAVCLKVHWLNSAVLYSGRNRWRLSPNSETTCGSPWAQKGACSQSLKCLQIFTGLCWALSRRCWLLLSKLHCGTAKPDSHAVLQLHITFCQIVCMHQTRRNPMYLVGTQDLLYAPHIDHWSLLW